MLDDIRLTLDEHIAQGAPDFTDESPKPEHGRRERRSIWVSSALNDYLDFPGVGQVFAVGRQTVEVNSGKRHSETVYGVTSLSPQRIPSTPAHPQSRALDHEATDWSFDAQPHPRPGEHSRPHQGARARRRRLARNPRRVLDFLKMTATPARAAPA